MTEPVRWGVIGTAMIATERVIPAMPGARLTELTGIASRTLSKAEGVAERFDIPKAYGAYEDLLADPDIEAVYIPLPNGFHAEWSIKAMRAGKHVLCEKPLAMDAAEAREIQAVRDETGMMCLEAFAYRFNPAVAKAFEIAQSGVLGELRFMHTVSCYLMERPYDPTNVRLRAEIGGGALYDMGCYAVNAQRMMAGREPLMVSAMMQWSTQFDVDMSGTALLDFGDGLRGTIQWGFTAPGGPFSVIGERGRLTGPYGWGAPEGKPAMVLMTGDGIEEIFVERANDYTGEVQDLSEAIRGVAEPRYLWEPLDANMRVIDALYRSYHTGCPQLVGA
ncbi:MAG: Gfo/Idh/MocA family oxidoreductase [Anaerolineae bacterium]|nr:Gfo/Idh/MocA family oxidoreductase [Anaerolineae bacterium]